MKQRLLFFALVILVFSFAVHAEDIEYSRVPGWVTSQDYSVDHADPGDGTTFLLFQRELDADLKAAFNRLVYRFESPQGVEDNSIISIDVDPQYEELDIHWIRLIRNGRVVNQPDEVWYLQQETQLEYLIYNGTQSAHIILEDVQEGDIVDYAYSIKGRNPAFSHFNAFFDLAWGSFVGRYSYRILSNQPLHFDYSAAGDVKFRQNRSGRRNEYTLMRSSVSQIHYEDSTPEWYVQYPYIGVSSHPDWSSVVEWALPNYQTEESPYLAALAARICDGLETETDQAEALADYVQTQIRYLGLEIGAGSHVPTNAEKTAKRRFGDCKDKTMLLINLLRIQGIPAQPVLVHAGQGRRLPETGASPYQFNHVITRILLDSNWYYLDATNNTQNGTVQERSVYNLHYGLVIAEGENQLTELPEPPMSSLTIHMEFDLSDDANEADLMVTTIAKGLSAESHRSYFESTTIEEANRAYLNFFLEDYPGMERTADIEFRDQKSWIEITDHYRITDMIVSDDDGSYVLFWPSDLYDDLSVPYTRKRTAPIHLGSVRQLKVNLSIALPDSDWNIGEYDEDFNTDYYSYDYHHEFTEYQNLFKIHYTWTVQESELPAEAVDDYLEHVDYLFDNASTFVNVTDIAGSGGSDAPGMIAPLMVLALILIPVILGVRGSRRRKKLNQGIGL